MIFIDQLRDCVVVHQGLAPVSAHGTSQLVNRRTKHSFCFYTLISLLFLHFSTAAYCFDWSTSELHYQYGNLNQPFQQRNAATSIVTFQHASGWRYGDNFLFVDTIMAHGQKVNFYGEYYGNLSLGKITGKDLAIGPIKDFGVLNGVNWAPNSGMLKYLPGLRLSWDIPGFQFLNSDFTAYIDNSDSKIAESDSFMADINGRYPFELLNSKFSIEGHMEYIGERTNQFGLVRAWFFSQIQLRYDLGNLILAQPEKVYIGTEWQYWKNKFGTSVEENAFQALLVWRM